MKFEDYSKRPIDRSPEALLMTIERMAEESRKSMKWIHDETSAQHYAFRQRAEQLEAVAVIIRESIAREQRDIEIVAQIARTLEVPEEPKTLTIKEHVVNRLRQIGVIR